MSLPIPDAAMVQTVATNSSSQGTILAFPEQADIARCHLSLCCPVLAAWLYSAYSATALGTGSGDVLALDVSAGQLSWKINDCHPGGVRAISSLANGSTFYTSGADGMICAIDFTTGNLLEKFKASSKAVTSISVSPDGKKLATAAAQLKIFNCSNKKD
ncbi:hypothetical protein KIW84_056813 [Lathyrus oleraceus]|uniref:Uncharacterized protein n=1 Tax=Pisum sativum TaxID=3888 RepID=A0A9D4X1Y1_PEA|nr:hypothetical protein KIW84_056811 [Pisum sativum]KAI5411887.1 hypothetical protein KIW84_056813 [Pisum sativum]